MRKRVDYVRDKRSPVPSNDVVSITMSSNKAKNTLPELTLRRALRDAGHGGYRLHWNIHGRPDICFPGKRVAIFVNGCFWHRCPRCDLPLPKSNTGFWMDKFEKNVKRDMTKKERLEEDAWTVIVVWECEIRQNLDDVVSRIAYALMCGDATLDP